MTIEKLFQEAGITKKQIVVLNIALTQVVEQYEEMLDKTEMSEGLVKLTQNRRNNMAVAIDAKTGKPMDIDELIKNLKDECTKFGNEYGKPAKELMDKFKPVFDLIKDVKPNER